MKSSVNKLYRDVYSILIEKSAVETAKQLLTSEM